MLPIREACPGKACRLYDACMVARVAQAQLDFLGRPHAYTTNDVGTHGVSPPGALLLLPLLLTPQEFCMDVRLIPLAARKVVAARDSFVNC